MTCSKDKVCYSLEYLTAPNWDNAFALLSVSFFHLSSLQCESGL